MKNKNTASIIIIFYIENIYNIIYNNINIII